MNYLCDFLGVSDEEYEYLEELGLELLEDTGNSGEMIYSFYFKVPDDTPIAILDKTGWKVGETIYIPTHVVSHDSDKFEYEYEHEYEMQVAQAEANWIRENPQSGRLNDFLTEMQIIRERVSEANLFTSKLEYRMAYSYAVTLLEAFLSETAKHVIACNDKALLNAAEYFSEVENAPKFSLSTIIRLNVRNHILGLISTLTFHNIKQTNRFFTKIFSNEVDLSYLKDIVKTRHDISHRNGRRRTGEEVDLDFDSLYSVFDEIVSAAKLIQDMALSLDDVK